MPDYEAMILARQDEMEIWEDCGADTPYEYEYLDLYGDPDNYYRTRKPFKPVRGCQYRLASDYPADYICTWVDPNNDEADMMNITSKWTTHCHGLGMYVDNRIDWDYSTGGHFNA